ncbi:MAG: hypothetical protein RIQ44_425, partial [Actinomycetota bacterium]
MSNPQKPLLSDLQAVAASPVTRRTILAGAGIGAAAMTL